MGLFVSMQELDLIAKFDATKNYFRKKKYLVYQKGFQP